MTSIPETIELNERYRGKEGKEARALAEHALKARLKALLDDFDNVHPDFLHDVSTTVLDELLSDARKGWQLPDGDFFAELLADCPPVENPLFQRETLQEQVVELPPRDGDQFEHTCQLVLTRKGEITPEHVENIARTYVETWIDIQEMEAAAPELEQTPTSSATALLKQASEELHEIIALMDTAGVDSFAELSRRGGELQ